MHMNLSLILNIIFLIVVIIAILKIIRERSGYAPAVKYSPSFGDLSDARSQPNDIIAVRKITPLAMPAAPRPGMANTDVSTNNALGKTAMLFLVAKEDQQFLGYELLQTVLASGLRFGEGHLFHRYQNLNGQGQIACSLAAATANGTFDLQNIGTFSVRGLCLFMKYSGNNQGDAENLKIMHDTARQLSVRLDANMLDADRNQITDVTKIT